MLKASDFTIVKSDAPLERAIKFDVVLHARFNEIIPQGQIMSTPPGEWSKMLENAQREAYAGFVKYVYGDIVDQLIEVSEFTQEDLTKEIVDRLLEELDSLLLAPLDQLHYQDRYKDDVEI